jgi:hypothetical protein
VTRALLAATLLALGAVRVEAQTVGGIVRDARTGAVVENASVLLRNAADSSVAYTRTDSAGVFYLNAPAPGTYSLLFNLGSGPERATPPFELATIESFHQNTFVVEVPDDPYFFEFQVEKPVEPLNNVSPGYPRRLQEESVEGMVIAQFVVDTLVRAEVGTLKATEFTHREFFEAVRGTLPRMQFRAAEVRGRKVRQLVQQAFAFKIGRTIPSLHRPPGSEWPPPLPRTRPPR